MSSSTDELRRAAYVIDYHIEYSSGTIAETRLVAWTDANGDVVKVVQFERTVIYTPGILPRLRWFEGCVRLGEDGERLLNVFRDRTARPYDGLRNGLHRFTRAQEVRSCASECFK